MKLERVAVNHTLATLSYVREHALLSNQERSMLEYTAALLVQVVKRASAYKIEID